jgi:LPXTG-motif cell wall-anchored protein
MPKARSKRRYYEPPPKKKPRPSPRWFGGLIVALLLLGVAVIVTNYLGVIPGTGGRATNLYLFVGLGLIASGFLAATQWR